MTLSDILKAVIIFGLIYFYSKNPNLNEETEVENLNFKELYKIREYNKNMNKKKIYNKEILMYNMNRNYTYRYNSIYTKSDIRILKSLRISI